MRLEYAAHVDHPISHTADGFTIGLALTGAIIAAAVVSSGGILAIVATASLVGGVAMDAGRIIDSFRAPSTEGKITSGFATVLLGPQTKPAARANMADTKVDCHDEQVAEGSKIVMLGPETKPMSRRQDRTKCGGVIADGVRSIIVGGERSQEGVDIEEQESSAVWYIDTAFNIGGGVSSLARARNAGDFIVGTLELTAGGAEIAGFDRTADIIGLTGLAAPQNIFEAIDSAKSLFDGGQAAVEVTGEIVSPSPPARPPS